MDVSRRAFAAGALATAFAPPRAESAPARWNDVHLHVIGGLERQFALAVDSAIAGLDAFGIAKAVVFPPPMPRLGLFDYVDYVPELRRYPGRFGFLAGGGILNPLIHQYRRPADVTASVKQTFVDHANRMLDAGAVGFGEIAVLHLSLVPNHPFEEVVVEHPLLLALVEVAGRRKAVIDLHMDAVPGESMPAPASLKVPPNPPVLHGNIAGFERLLAHDRDARIVWAHGGSDFTGHMTPALIGRLMDAHPNLFMSLRPLPLRAATSNPFGLRIHNLILGPGGIAPPWLALLRRHSDRFVMGGDAFFLSSSVPPESPLVALSRGNQPRLTAARAMLAALPRALQANIAVDNAARLYRL
jgi:Amidohydrolase